MSNFTNLDHYIIPADLLLDIINAYQHQGFAMESFNQITSNLPQLKELTFNNDAKALCTLMDLDISVSRQSILLDKDGTPRNKKEEVLKNIKNVLKDIEKDAKTYSLNPSLLIEYLNQIYGKHTITYVNTLVKNHPLKQKVTIRSYINQIFDEHNDWQENQKYEANILMINLYLEVVNLLPYSDHNDIASMLLLYYLLQRNNITIFKYQSFFSLLIKHFDEFMSLTKAASLNYADGYLNATKLYQLLFQIIVEAYEDFKAQVKTFKFNNATTKSINVEATIYKLPEIFTKDDIRKLNPLVSDATINRILIKMRDEELIMPLGTGRSAKWKKLMENINNADLSKILGE